LFPVLSADREAVQAHLASAGIGTLVHYPVPIPRQPALADQQPADCPIADRVCGQVFSLPLYPRLAREAIARVAAALAAM
jgi:UDP-2-acetamido-2-deoxy-ribo-hexuluronate aminotransferase